VFRDLATEGGALTGGTNRRWFGASLRDATLAQVEMNPPYRWTACPPERAGVGEVLSRADLVARVAAARAAGRTIAFASGCFDLLHVGHVRYLDGAAQQADVLVVAVHDDDSVRRLKGEGRPILAAEHRAELVASVRSVDVVVIVPEPAVVPLVDAVHPDVYCTGTDDTADAVSERESVSEIVSEIVTAYGGRMAIVGGPKAYSTRDLLARIAESPS
jgi:D-glycero-beta-D-manno-heptose 1-phosphate adenylyltransferase